MVYLHEYRHHRLWSLNLQLTQKGLDENLILVRAELLANSMGGMSKALLEGPSLQSIG